MYIHVFCCMLSLSLLVNYPQKVSLIHALSFPISKYSLVFGGSCSLTALLRLLDR